MLGISLKAGCGQGASYVWERDKVLALEANRILEQIMTSKILKNVATNILRNVSPQNAFYFYRAIGAPTGAAARSLTDFLGVINTIDITSLQFHLGRGDFENWIKMLGDNTLAKQLAGLKEKRLRGEELRTELVGTVKARLDTLQNTKP